MKLKELQSHLEGLQGFDSPKPQLEQYVTTPHLAAQMLFTASNQGDIEEKSVLDLGTGCGILASAAAICGAAYVLGVDTDSDALEIAQANLDTLDLDFSVDLVQGRLVHPPNHDPNQPSFLDRFSDHFDTVIMNPPFGTKTANIDMIFLQHACAYATTSVYSLHKSSTREFIAKKVQTWGWSGQVMAVMKYDLPKTMRFHKQKTLDIEVDFWRFERKVNNK